jgi:hypothetical protein
MSSYSCFIPNRNSQKNPQFKIYLVNIDPTNWEKKAINKKIGIPKFK